MAKLKVALIGEMQAKGYSGGRYSAWTMAEALADQGDEVYFITGAIPEFSRDFKGYSGHKNIKPIIVSDYSVLDDLDLDLDYMIYITDTKPAGPKYQALHYAISHNVRFAISSFETPNWYNEYAKIARDLSAYEAFRDICGYGCLVFSLAREGEKYAKQFYNKNMRRTQFEVWSPAINSRTADLVNAERENQIMIFLRVTDAHKGGDDFVNFLGEEIRGAKILCVSGAVDIPEDYKRRVEDKASKYGITINYARALNDRQKFEALKHSKILLFPSHFEGYGYPPVEALYCGTKCLAYDLPVLREISGDEIEYFEHGDTDSMRIRAGEILRENNFSKVQVDTASFEKQAERLHEILERNLDNKKLQFKGLQKNLYLKKCEKKLENKSEIAEQDHSDLFKRLAENNTIISNKLDTKNENWKTIKARLSGKKVFVWGYGAYYNYLIGKYGPRLNPVAIIDKNEKYKGTIDAITNKYMIETPDYLDKYNPEDVAVFISNKNYVDEIITELNGMGIKDVHSLCMMEMNEMVEKK